MAKRYFETNGGGGGVGVADDGVSRDSGVAESMAVVGGVADGKPSSVTAAAAASGGVGFQGDAVVGPWRWETSTFSPNAAAGN